MTKRQILLANIIKLHQHDLAWHVASPHNIKKDRQKISHIQRLQKRLKINLDPKTVLEESLFGKQFTYPDGTKHFISNTWLV